MINGITNKTSSNVQKAKEHVKLAENLARRHRRWVSSGPILKPEDLRYDNARSTLTNDLLAAQFHTQIATFYLLLEDYDDEGEHRGDGKDSHPEG